MPIAVSSLDLSTTRRHFLAGAVAATLVSRSSGAGHGDTLDVTSGALALYDPREAVGRAFARTVRARGVEAVAVAGDVTAVWLQRLQTFWNDKAGMLVGVTSLDALFCLDVLARDAGYRLTHFGKPFVQPAELLRAAALGRRTHLDRLPSPNERSLQAWAFAPRGRR